MSVVRSVPVEKSYYVQRCATRLDFTRKGVDSVLGLDYMGSSEFEWGATGDCLKVMRERMSDIEMKQLQYGCALTRKQFNKDYPKLNKYDCDKYNKWVECHNGEMLYLITYKDHMEAAAKDIEELIFQGRRLKEGISIRSVCNPTLDIVARDIPHVDRENCWWSLDGHWFAVIGKVEAQYVLKALRQEPLQSKKVVDGDIRFGDTVRFISDKPNEGIISGKIRGIFDTDSGPQYKIERPVTKLNATAEIFHIPHAFLIDVNGG